VSTGPRGLSPPRAATAAPAPTRTPRSRAARASTAPAEAPRPRRAPARKPTTRAAAAPRARLRVGRLAIPLIALMLAGVVWVNVAKLALTTETGRVVDQARSVEAETVRLKGRLEQQGGAVNARAREQLGMVDPPSQSLVILDVPAQGR
jgi:cell division protein FtsL